MTLSNVRLGVVLAVMSAALFTAFGCGGDDPAAQQPAVPTAPAAVAAAGPTATASPSPTVAPQDDTTVTAAATQEAATPAPSSASATAQPRAYEPRETMYQVFSGQQSTAVDFFEALAEARLRGDRSQVPVIIDMMRFLGPGEVTDQAALTLRELTGQDFGGGAGDWSRWVEFLGKNSADYRPPEGYPAWKANLFATVVDPRYTLFLGSARTTDNFDVTEIAWGGVLPDGIPDLNLPPHIPAAEADYLGFEERVFGVSINGEHRAYPVRIMNPHEMANDFVGGEPIALAY